MFSTLFVWPVLREALCIHESLLGTIILMSMHTCLPVASHVRLTPVFIVSFLFFIKQVVHFIYLSRNMSLLWHRNLLCTLRLLLLKLHLAMMFLNLCPSCDFFIVFQGLVLLYEIHCFLDSKFLVEYRTVPVIDQRAPRLPQARAQNQGWFLQVFYSFQRKSLREKPFIIWKPLIPLIPLWSEDKRPKMTKWFPVFVVSLQSSSSSFIPFHDRHCPCPAFLVCLQSALSVVLQSRSCLRCHYRFLMHHSTWYSSCLSLFMS